MIIAMTHSVSEGKLVPAGKPARLTVIVVLERAGVGRHDQIVAIHFSSPSFRIVRTGFEECHPCEFLQINSDGFKCWRDNDDHKGFVSSPRGPAGLRNSQSALGEKNDTGPSCRREAVANPEELNRWLGRLWGEASGVHVGTPALTCYGPIRPATSSLISTTFYDILGFNVVLGEQSPFQIGLVLGEGDLVRGDLQIIFQPGG